MTFKTGVGFTDRLRLGNGIVQGMQSSPLAYIIFVNRLIATLASMGEEKGGKGSKAIPFNLKVTESVVD